MTTLFKTNIGNLFLISSLLALSVGCQPKVTEPEPEKAPPKPAANPEAKEAPKMPKGPLVVLKTNKGDITIELNPEKAPVTVKNFLQYVDDGFYDGVVFHRVMEGFMIQTGGFELKQDGSIEQKKTRGNIENEAKNGLKNGKGSLAMARTSAPHSASAQFFINHGNNSNLDYPSSDGWGYAVFGKVIEGLDIVDAIATVQTTTKPLKARADDQLLERPMQNVPVANVIIESVKRK